jgi:CheY-like chemotaxis protein
MPSLPGQPAVVLLAEDDPGDVLMITEAFGQSAAPVQLHVVGDGEQAIDYVRRNGPAAPRPALILLDLNMPRRNGFEVLAVLKTDAGSLSIPIVVLTTSSAEDDVQRCYALHANAYITKPVDYAGLAEVIRQLTASFLGLITLPPNGPAGHRG